METAGYTVNGIVPNFAADNGAYVGLAVRMLKQARSGRQG